MAITNIDDGSSKPSSASRHRAGRGAQRGARDPRRPARPLPGDGRRPPAHAGRARRAHRHARALRARVAQRPGRRRLRRLRPGERTLHAAARARARPRRRGQPGLHDRALPGRVAAVAARERLAERVPHRRRRRLARAPPRPLRRHRAGLRARATARPGRRVAARARRRRRQARGRRARRRRRLRPRRLDDPDGAGVPSVALRRLRLPRGVDRDRARARREAGVADRVRSRSPARQDYAGRGLRPRRVLRLRSTTWATPSARRAPRGGGARPGGTCMLVEPFAGDRVEDNLNPSAACTTGSRRSSARPARCRSRPRGARHAGRRGKAARGAAGGRFGRSAAPPRRR